MRGSSIPGDFDNSKLSASNIKLGVPGHEELQLDGTRSAHRKRGSYEYANQEPVGRRSKQASSRDSRDGQPHASKNSEAYQNGELSSDLKA